MRTTPAVASVAAAIRKRVSGSCRISAARTIVKMVAVWFNTAAIDACAYFRPPSQSIIWTYAASAHHSFAMFDRSIEKVVTGSVVRWAFNNPHSWLYVNVKNKDGSETLWSFEGSSPTQLLQRGITGFSFEPGSTITIQFCPLKDGRPGGGIGWVKLANGTFVSPADGGCNGSAEAIERWKVWLAKGYTSSTEAQNAK